MKKPIRAKVKNAGAQTTAATMKPRIARIMRLLLFAGSVRRRRHSEALLERRAERRGTIVANGTSDFADAHAVGQQGERRQHAALPAPSRQAQPGLLDEQPFERAQARSADLSGNELERPAVVGPAREMLGELARAFALRFRQRERLRFRADEHVLEQRERVRVARIALRR